MRVVAEWFQLAPDLLQVSVSLNSKYRLKEKWVQKWPVIKVKRHIIHKLHKHCLHLTPLLPVTVVVLPQMFDTNLLY